MVCGKTGKNDVFLHLDSHNSRLNRSYSQEKCWFVAGTFLTCKLMEYKNDKKVKKIKSPDHTKTKSRLSQKHWNNEIWTNSKLVGSLFYSQELIIRKLEFENGQKLVTAGNIWSFNN